MMTAEHWMGYAVSPDHLWFLSGRNPAEKLRKEGLRPGVMAPRLAPD